MTGDEFEHDDAAYVLGALDPEERRVFEGHLLDCAACRERVAIARLTVDALTPLDEAAFREDTGDFDGHTDEHVDAGPVPETLLPQLLRRARVERRRRRALVGGLAAVAAACVVALVVAVWPSNEPAGPPTRPFVALRSAPVEASALLVSREWGTEIKLQCRYTRDLEQGTAYRLVVIDSAQRRFDAGGWTLGRSTTEFTGGTQVPRSDISAVQITLTDGRPILQLTP